jgi:hypothetical protein
MKERAFIAVSVVTFVCGFLFASPFFDSSLTRLKWSNNSCLWMSTQGQRGFIQFPAGIPTSGDGCVSKSFVR